MFKYLFILFIPIALTGQEKKNFGHNYIKKLGYQTASTTQISPPNISEMYQIQTNAIEHQTLVPMGKIIPIEISDDVTHKIIIDKTHEIASLQVTSFGAKGLTAYMSNVFLPIGSKLFVSNEDKSQIFGPFTLQNVKNNRLVLPMIEGDFMSISIISVRGAILKPKFTITELGYNFGNLTKVNNSSWSRGFGDSEDCEVNIACEEGDEWRKQEKSVVRIKLRIDDFEGFCTGTLMNNTHQDCTPYLLTADHCNTYDGKNATEENYNDWQFTFNYASNKCANSSEKDIVSETYTGCKKVANSKRKGEGGPDFLLLKLSDNLIGNSSPYFSGWQNFDETSPSGVMIHHPSGDIKKISTYNTAIVESEWNAKYGEDTHWEVYWSKTENGLGVSEPGSSGAALFNNQGRVIGVLTGGASSCLEDVDAGTSPNYPDLFGKFSLAWGWLGFDTESSLFEHLDGSNHAQFIDGIEWPCNEKPLFDERAEVLSADEIILFPNPVKADNKELKIDFKKNTHQKIEIYNVYGSKIQSISIGNQSVLNLDVSLWLNGVYFILLHSNSDKILTKKFVIERN